MVEPCLLVIKAGGTFPEMARELGDFEDWIIRGLCVPPGRCRVADVERGDALPGPETVLGAVISGSHAMVTEEAAWSLALENWTRRAVAGGMPLLGICYGHQVLARAMGGTVDFHPQGTEIGTVDISCLEACRTDPLFSRLPDTFKGHVVHSQTVTGLPAGAVPLAANTFEPHHAFRIGEVAWGVQFHPEFDESAEQGYIRNLSEKARAQGQDPDQLVAAVRETPHAAALLKGFGELALCN
ncbi:MAG: glutamine amidotransferase [Desulfobacter sp.]|nr:MAG: glutamine amidotransferase [Desulfobacter sp.]